MDENDSYSRSHRTSQCSDDRRTSSTSNREYYDGYRSMGSHTRSRHDEDPWYPDAGRFREEDVYRREGGYDTGMRRDSDWVSRSAGDSSYDTVRDEWPLSQRYDPPSYHDSSSWGTTSTRDAYDSRSSYYDDWSRTSTRGPSSHVRDDGRHLRHNEVFDREDIDWSRDRRGGKGGQQLHFQNDSAWDLRRRENGWDDRAAEDPQSLEERAWEPAPSWRSTHRDEGNNSENRTQSQNQNHRTSLHKNQQQSKGKRNYSHKQQRRDWRNDDSSLNKYASRVFPEIYS